MKMLQEAVVATLRYAAFFKFPLTPTEVHYWLASGHQVSQTRVNSALQSPGLPRSLRRFVSKTLTPTRRYRASISQKKLALAAKVARLISLVPTVKLVALTGSAAIGNSTSSDDLDLMVVTAADTLWLTRPLVVLMVELFFHRRHPQKQSRGIPNAVCLNLWLDGQSLAVPEDKRNLYTAHEVLQLQPLINRKRTYEQFLSANSWVGESLANAWAVKQEKYSPVKLRQSGGSIWSGPNHLAFKLQYAYMRRKITRETVDLHRAYFHPQDWHPVIDSFLKKELKLPGKD